MKQTVIQIENLKCHGCAATIKKGLLKFDTVSEVNVDVEKSEVSISYEGKDEQIQEFKTKLAGLGYPEAGTNNSTFTMAKSYVSCAVGRFTVDI